MNLNLIDEMLPLLSPAARKYLGEIRSGRRPVVLPEGISDVPQGLSAAGTRALHRIAQTQDPKDLNISNIVNSGILIRRLNQNDMRNPDLPRSDRELFDRLYEIRGGTGVPAAGPLEQGPQVSEVQQPRAQPVAEQPAPSEPRGRGETAGAADTSGRPAGGVQRGERGEPRPAPQQPQRQMITSDAALQQLAGFLPENQRVYFLSGVTDLAQIRREYPDADTTVPAKVRQDLAKLRNSVLSGNLDRGLAGKYFSGAGRNQGARASAAQEVVDSVIRVEGRPDPLGRDTGAGGFGRTGQVPQAQGSGVDTSSLAGISAASGRRVDTSSLAGIMDASGQAPATATATEPGGGETTTGPTGGPGAGITGGVTGGVTGGAAAAGEPAVPTNWEAAAAELYPEYYAVVRNNPEIADLLRRSLGPPEWSREKFDAELKKTNWYRTTSAAAREWDTKSVLDPATYQAMVDEAATAINQQALALGIRLSDESVQKLALDSQRFQFGTQKIIDSIGMLAVESGMEGVTQLRNGYYGQEVRKLARQYGVSLSDTTFNSFVNKIAVGEENLDSFQDYALNIAKSLYPPLADKFDAGLTFNDVTDNYRQIAANLLERDVESIDMTSPEWVQAVTYQPDPKTGEQRMMNLREWGDYLRNTDSFGYQYTTEAKSRAYEVANTLANMFGRI